MRVDVRSEAKRALPYAAVLALALGIVVWVGANLSNAFPSEQRPYGWSGPSSFENAVAMVRGDLVLATSLPALALGVRALHGRDPRSETVGAVASVFALHAALLVTACFIAGLIGAWGSSKAPAEAITAFGTAHSVLALAFYAIAFLCGAILRRHAMPMALAVWLWFNGAHESLARVMLFRQEGYHKLASGEFPAWFYVSQVLSPLSAYRGTLITWRKGFRDYVEHATLDNATLPGWMTPGTFAVLALALWVLLPLGLAALAWWWRGKRTARQRAATLIDAT